MYKLLRHKRSVISTTLKQMYFITQPLTDRFNPKLLRPSRMFRPTDVIHVQYSNTNSTQTIKLVKLLSASVYILMTSV